jgi:phosphohistidine phosphatase
MKLVLIRHGIAEKKGSDKPDEERRLTDEGNQKMRTIARGLARLLPGAEAIYSSPLVRAVETAQWVARAYGGKLTVETTAALKPGAGAEAFRELLRTSRAECAFFVGHEPDLTALMLDLARMSSQGELELKKGGCYGLEVENGAGTLIFMLTPSMLQ